MKKSQTVLITGSSSGIGEALVYLFQQKGWNVAATMRHPENHSGMNQLEKVKTFQLDVLDHHSINLAINGAIEVFGDIDLLINNAGYANFGPFEAASDEQIKKQFETNVLGPMRLIKAILPTFRKKKSGTIVNVASLGSRMVLPYFTLYHATKYALRGFTESLYFELQPFNIKLKLIEPGRVDTNFSGRSLDINRGAALVPYKERFEKFCTNAEVQDPALSPSTPKEIAEEIYQAATDFSPKVNYIVGKDAKKLYENYRVMSESDYHNFIEERYFS